MQTKIDRWAVESEQRRALARDTHMHNLASYLIEQIKYDANACVKEANTVTFIDRVFAAITNSTPKVSGKFVIFVPSTYVGNLATAEFCSWFNSTQDVESLGVSMCKCGYTGSAGGAIFTFVLNK